MSIFIFAFLLNGKSLQVMLQSVQQKIPKCFISRKDTYLENFGKVFFFSVIFALLDDWKPFSFQRLLFETVYSIKLFTYNTTIWWLSYSSPPKRSSVGKSSLHLEVTKHILDDYEIDTPVVTEINIPLVSINKIIKYLSSILLISIWAAFRN